MDDAKDPEVAALEHQGVEVKELSPRDRFVGRMMAAAKHAAEHAWDMAERTREYGTDRDKQGSVWGHGEMLWPHTPSNYLDTMVVVQVQRGTNLREDLTRVDRETGDEF